MLKSQTNFPLPRRDNLPTLTLASFAKSSDKKCFRTLTIRSRSNSEASSAMIESNMTSSGVHVSEPHSVNEPQCHEGVQHLYSSKHLVVFRPRARSVSSSQKNSVSDNLASVVKMKEDLLILIAQVTYLLQNLVTKTNSELVSLNGGIHDHWLTFLSFLTIMYNKLIEKKQNKADDGESYSMEFADERQISRKNEVKPLTLVLDLDETLVHSSKIRPETDHEALIVEQSNGSCCQVFVKRRPYLDLFLEKMSQEFNLIIFTASHMQYAEAAINLIDQSSYISQKLFRESCERVNKNQWIKDLRKINQDLSRIIFIDNEEIAASLQPENLMYIKPWYDSETDDELLKYMEVLLKFAEEWKASEEEKKDIRNFISKQSKGKMLSSSEGKVQE